MHNLASLSKPLPIDLRLALARDMKLYLLFFLGSGLAQIIPFDQTLPILTNPVVHVRAEEELHYQYEFLVCMTAPGLPLCRIVNARNVTCQATLTFENATFLPISGIASPNNCAGDQVARFQIPGSVPNGAAAMEW
jgi:hypothetical protein